MQSEDAMTKLRAAGLRLTPQRRAVIDVLSGERSHPSAEEVAAQVTHRVPGVSLSTVYKTLHEFANLGLVRELDVPGPMRFDSEATDHAHIVCSGCGKVADFELPDSVMAALIGAAPNLRVSSVDVAMHVKCASCSAAQSTQNAGEGAHHPITGAPDF